MWTRLYQELCLESRFDILWSARHCACSRYAFRGRFAQAAEHHPGDDRRPGVRRIGLSWQSNH